MTAESLFGATKANDLGRLFTNHHSAIDSTSSTATNQAAFQLAVWEIVNEAANTTYLLSSGTFRVTGTGASLAQQWLGELNNTPSANLYAVNVWSMIQGPSGSGPQDVAVFSLIPEPGTGALLLAGAAMLGFALRGRRGRRLAPSLEETRPGARYRSPRLS